MCKVRDFNRFGLVFLAFVSLFLVSGCSSDSYPEDPKQTLTDYISKSFNARSSEDRVQLLRYLTGDAWQRLSAWSDDQFEEAFVGNKKKFSKLRFREVKKVTGEEVNVTYELSYYEKRSGKRIRITQKKICQMLLEGSRWKIATVRNIKELIEYENEMSLP